LLVLAAVGGLAAAEGVSAQNDLSLEPTASSVSVGQEFQVRVLMDFSEATVGGGVALAFDPARVSLVGVSVETGDSDFACPGSPAIACPVQPAYLSFGSVTGLTGQGTVATITLMALASGSLTLALEPATPFGTPGGGELAVGLTGATLESLAPALPLLSERARVLLALALGAFALAALRSRRVAQASLLLLAFVLVVLPARSVGAADADLDGIDDSVDNCTNVANADQRDSNADGYGNLCDADLDDDEDVDAADLALMKAAFFGADADADLDGDGNVDFLDLGWMSGSYGGVPGPTCSGCAAPPASGSFCGPSGGSLAIPDDAQLQATDTLSVAESIAIVDLDVFLRVSHGWVGDLSVSLRHDDTGSAVDLIDRPGVPASGFGCSASDIDATLDDEASLPAEDACATPAPALAGALVPAAALSAFHGEDAQGSWTLTLVDSSLGVSGSLEEWCLRVNDPPPPVLPPVVGLTAYRPQSEAYGAPLQRRSVPDAEEETPGAGIRINGDDDDANSTPDRDDTSVSAENDLIEVEWDVNQVTAPAGVEYVIRRSNGNIKVWDSASKGTAILDATDESVLSPSALTGSIWVENTHGGEAVLTFEARTNPGGVVISSDQVNFFPFTSLVIGLHGEFQFPTDPVFGPNEGVSYIAVALHQEAYDSHMYVENDVAADGSGAVYDEIVSAVQDRGVTGIALYGFSHGGGSIYDLSERLEANKASIGDFDILFSAYIDGIENDSDVDLDAEVRLPLGTGYHVNYYQSFGIIPPWGGSVAGADVDVNVTSTLWGFLLVHITITNSAIIQSGIHDPLVQLVPR